MKQAVSVLILKQPRSSHYEIAVICYEDYSTVVNHFFQSFHGHHNATPVSNLLSLEEEAYQTFHFLLGGREGKDSSFTLLMNFRLKSFHFLKQEDEKFAREQKKEV